MNKMDKNKICSYLKNKNIWFEITEHKPVFTMKELADIPPSLGFNTMFF